MSRDDDALSWAGDDDPSLITSRPEGPEAGAGAESLAVKPERESRGGVLRWLSLVLVIAATAGWVMILVVNPVRQPNIVGLAMYQLGEVLAVVTPLAWWLAVDRFAPRSRAATLWLVGLVLTAPWPLVVGMFA